MIEHGTVAAEEAWISVLDQEARRDLVFLWHITQGCFGGPTLSEADVPALVERVTRALLERGCILGFGDPSVGSWKVPSELNGSLEEVAAKATALWKRAPNEWEFLAFVQR